MRTRSIMPLLLVLGCTKPQALENATAIPDDAPPEISISLDDPDLTMLVASMPAADKAILEALVKAGTNGAGGAVPVHWNEQEKEMHIVNTCTVAGAYGYHSTTFTFSEVEFYNMTELRMYAPLLVVTLSSYVQRYNRVAMHLGVRGVYVLKDTSVFVSENPQCQDVTHVISSMSIGSYYNTVGTKVGGGIDTSIDLLTRQRAIGAGVDAEKAYRVVDSAGNPNACKDNKVTDEPIPECSSPLQITLQEVRSLSCTMVPGFQTPEIFNDGKKIPLGTCSQLEPGRGGLFVSGTVTPRLPAQKPGEAAPEVDAPRLVVTVETQAKSNGNWEKIRTRDYPVTLTSSDRIMIGEMEFEPGLRYKIISALKCGPDEVERCHLDTDFTVSLELQERDDESTSTD